MGFSLGPTFTSMIKGQGLFVDDILGRLNQNPNSINEGVPQPSIDEKDLQRLSTVLKLSEEDARKLFQGYVPEEEHGVEHT